MRTEELMRKYLRGAVETPTDGWQRLVWHAADLMRMATELRNTRRTTKTARKSKFVQEDLFA